MVPQPAKWISSFDSFRQGLRRGKCLLARRFGHALGMSRRAAGQGRAKTGERANRTTERHQSVTRLHYELYACYEYPYDLNG